MCQHNVKSRGFALLIVLGMFSLLIPLVLSVWTSSDFVLQIQLQREQAIKNRLLMQSVMRVCCAYVGQHFETLLLQFGARKSPLIITIARASDGGKQGAKVIVSVLQAALPQLPQALKMEMVLVEKEKHLYDMRCLLHKKTITVGQKHVVVIEVSHVTVGDCI